MWNYKKTIQISFIPALLVALLASPSYARAFEGADGSGGENPMPKFMQSKFECEVSLESQAPSSAAVVSKSHVSINWITYKEGGVIAAKKWKSGRIEQGSTEFVPDSSLVPSYSVEGHSIFIGLQSIKGTDRIGFTLKLQTASQTEGVFQFRVDEVMKSGTLLTGEVRDSSGLRLSAICKRLDW